VLVVVYFRQEEAMLPMWSRAACSNLEHSERKQALSVRLAESALLLGRLLDDLHGHLVVSHTLGLLFQV
jgi:hypothetical protein